MGSGKELAKVRGRWKLVKMLSVHVGSYDLWVSRHFVLKTPLKKINETYVFYSSLYNFSAINKL